MTDDEFFASCLLVTGAPVPLTKECADIFVAMLHQRLGYDPETLERMNWFFRFRKWAERH